MPSPAAPSARVLANRARRVVYNKAALDALYAGMADGLLELGPAIIAAARANALSSEKRPPAERHDPPMAETGNFVVYGLGKKVGGDEGGTGKPRAMKAPPDQVVLGVWFSSRVAHFKELGTIKEVARPFLLPAFNRLVPGAEKVLVPAMGKRAARVP